jgi:hypothetical protein
VPRQSARPAEQIDGREARQEADQARDDDKPQVMLGEQAGQDTEHRSSSNWAMWSQQIKRNHLFAVKYAAPWSGPANRMPKGGSNRPICERILNGS